MADTQEIASATNGDPSLPLTPLHPVLAAELEGMDLREPLSPAQASAIEAAMDRYAVLVFRDQRLDDAQQLAFGSNFGPVEDVPTLVDQGSRRLENARINDISNLHQDGSVMARDDRKRLFSLGNMLWHSDSSFKATPAKFSLLSARVTPGTDGNTEFADMRAAWDALDPAMQAQVRDLITEHSQIYSRGVLGFTEFTPEELAKWQPVPQRLVRRHPRTGRLSLFLSAHAGAIQGWPVPEARALLRDLTEHATQREFVHAHVWQKHDLVMWDNRVTMHRARRYDATQVRDLHRTTVADMAPTLQQAA